MKRRILVNLYISIALFLFFTNCASADDPDVIYQEKITFEISKRGDNSHRLTSLVEVKKTFLSERSTRNNLMRINEPFYAKISALKATFRNKRLKKRYFTTHLADVKDVFITDHKIHTLHFPGDISQGETAAYSFRQEYMDIAFIPIVFIPNIDYVKAFDIVFEHPKTTQIDFEVFFFREGIDYEIDRPNSKQTTLRFNEIGYQKALEYYPFNDFHAAILISIIENGNSINPVQPKAFLDWYAEKVDLKPTLSGDLENVLHEELSGSHSSIERLKTIYDYVQKNIRYVADHRSLNAITPREPSFTLDKSYGDCKDKAYLVTALAKRYNIDVDMALVAVRPSPSLKGLHLNEFDHVICAYDDGNHTIYFDPTAKHCEFGKLPEGDVQKQAFILNKKNPRREVIPAPNHDFSIEIKITGSISSPDNGSAVVVLRNDYFQEAMYAKTELSGVALENVFSQMIASHIYKISLARFQIIKENGNSLTLSAKADLSGFLISSVKRIYVPKTPFIVLNKDILKREADDLPIYLSSRDNLSMTLNLNVTGYKTTEGDFRLGKKKGSFFSASVRSDSKRATFQYDYRQPNKQIDSKNKTVFIGFCRKYLKGKKEMFILRNNKS